MSEFNHHGIQGQKWDVQNGPPYPLDHDKIRKTNYFEKYKMLNNQKKVLNSLNDKEYNFYSGDEYGYLDKKRINKDFHDKMKKILNDPTFYSDEHVIISKNKNVTMADLDLFYPDGDEWNISWATHTKARGNGVTQNNIKEAIKLVKKYSDLPIHAIIDPKNVASQKTALKAGFKYDKLVDENGKIYQKYIYK